MRIEYRDPTTLTPHPQNYRAHPPEQVAEICKSIRASGQYKNVVVNAEGQILAGHGVVQACIEMGQPEVAVHVFDGTEAEQKRLMVADNELSRKAEDDERELMSLLREVQEDFGDLRGTGWNEQEMKDRLAELAAEDFEGGLAQEDPGAGEVPEEPQTRLGDVWLCGEHRVVCGDCTEVEVVDAATGGAKVTAVLTDPPYQMAKDIANDDLGDDAFAQLHRDFVSILPAAEKCTFVSFHSPRTFPVLLDAAREVGWKFERMLTLYRPDKFPVHTWNGWVMASQSILVFSLAGGVWCEVHPAAHDTYRSTASDLGDEQGLHPTVKMTPVVSDLLSRIGDGAAFDPFLGSGTTLIAAEQLGRTCYGIELEPRYVDVAVRRWAQATGRVPTLEADGTEFEV